jgi:hypothetical protein
MQKQCECKERIERPVATKYLGSSGRYRGTDVCGHERNLSHDLHETNEKQVPQYQYTIHST